MQQPSVGRIVHYVSTALWADPGDKLAAIITSVTEDGSVNLCVFARNGTTFPMTKVAFDERGARGTWSWPVHVKPAPQAFDPSRTR
jgi:hypothetical protein